MLKVLFSMKTRNYGLEGVPLAVDITGVIRRVGTGVRSVIVGDRIFALTSRGSITDRVVLPSSLAVKLPDTLSFEDAATMPCCFTTAIHCLLNVGGLVKGQVSVSLFSLRPTQPREYFFQLPRLLVSSY